MKLFAPLLAWIAATSYMLSSALQCLFSDASHPEKHTRFCAVERALRPSSTEREVFRSHGTAMRRRRLPAQYCTG